MVDLSRQDLQSRGHKVVSLAEINDMVCFIPLTSVMTTVVQQGKTSGGAFPDDDNDDVDGLADDINDTGADVAFEGEEDLPFAKVNANEEMAALQSSGVCVLEEHELLRPHWHGVIQLFKVKSN